VRRASTVAVERRIRGAFARVEAPPPWCLVGSHEGSEPARVAVAFKKKQRWAALGSRFLDEAPDGLGSALSFFSDEAFRFYLPAYLIADLRKELAHADPLFHLTHGLTEDSRTERVNARRYGDRTWFDEARYRFSVFSRQQAAAIVAYLRFRASRDELEREGIEQALASFWIGRTAKEART
jgi:hypothetical protein